MRRPNESITIQLQIVLVSYPVWDVVLITYECGGTGESLVRNEPWLTQIRFSIAHFLCGNFLEQELHEGATLSF